MLIDLNCDELEEVHFALRSHRDWIGMKLLRANSDDDRVNWSVALQTTDEALCKIERAISPGGKTC